MEQACRHAIEKVEYDTEKYEGGGFGKKSVCGIQSGNYAAQQVTKCDDVSAFVLEAVKNVENEKYRNIGILCKDTKRAKDLYRAIGRKKGISLLTSKKRERAVISPIWLSKGLEFDYVIVVDADSETYYTYNDRNLLYVACTRAMHKLELIYSGEKTRLIK